MKNLLNSPLFYLSWLLIAVANLTTNYFIDPYLFGLAAFVTAGMSGVVLLLAAVYSRRNLGWALLAATPALVAFAVLSTFNWA